MEPRRNVLALPRARPGAFSREKGRPGSRRSTSGQPALVCRSAIGTRVRLTRREEREAGSQRLHQRGEPSAFLDRCGNTFGRLIRESRDSGSRPAPVSKRGNRSRRSSDNALSDRTLRPADPNPGFLPDREQRAPISPSIPRAGREPPLRPLVHLARREASNIEHHRWAVVGSIQAIFVDGSLHFKTLRPRNYS